jgi:hypothetical protein
MHFLATFYFLVAEFGAVASHPSINTFSFVVAVEGSRIHRSTPQQCT